MFKVIKNIVGHGPIPNHHTVVASGVDEVIALSNLSYYLRRKYQDIVNHPDVPSVIKENAQSHLDNPPELTVVDGMILIDGEYPECDWFELVEWKTFTDTVTNIKGCLHVNGRFYEFYGDDVVEACIMNELMEAKSIEIVGINGIEINGNVYDWSLDSDVTLAIKNTFSKVF